MKLKERTYQVYIPTSGYLIDIDQTITGDQNIKPWIKEYFRTPLTQIELWYRPNHISATDKSTERNICEFIAIDEEA